METLMAADGDLTQEEAFDQCVLMPEFETRAGEDNLIDHSECVAALEAEQDMSTEDATKACNLIRSGYDVNGNGGLDLSEFVNVSENFDCMEDLMEADENMTHEAAFTQCELVQEFETIAGEDDLISIAECEANMIAEEEMTPAEAANFCSNI
jgi:hypothetical protein